MNLNPNLHKINALPLKTPNSSVDPLVTHSCNFQHYEIPSKEHSRKTSQSSLRSLPLTSTSLSIHSDSKFPNSQDKSKKTQSFSKNLHKFTMNLKELEGNGDEPFELITQPEIPKLVWCAFCTAEHTTYTIYSNSTSTFNNSIMIFLLGGIFGCCLIPYFSKSCKDHKTVCSKCHHLISEIDE